ncbi:MAG TPA: DUF1893 domain-containing protein [Acidobacteriota bacterium]|nr:DUF1893 domain-containing protein [Acidobacteriota bacterium]
MTKESLRAYENGLLVFSSAGKWLHPLFEFEDFLRTGGPDPAGLFLHDRIVGRGAAYLTVRLGIRRSHAGLLSERGREVFLRFGVTSTHDELVERIDCMTEELLAAVDDVETAYAILAERRRAALEPAVRGAGR